MPASTSVPSLLSRFSRPCLNISSPTLEIILAIPAAGVDNASLTADIGGSVNSNFKLTGELGAKLVGGNPTLSVGGKLDTTIQGQPIEFQFEIDFQAEGLLLFGSFTGTIQFVVVELSNLIVEVGVDDAGVPSIGFGAEIAVSDFDSSVMILLDSNVPSQSMFIGAVSNINLGNVLSTLCGVVSAVPPAWLESLLAKVSLSGTKSFTLPASVSTSLDSRDLNAVSAAFTAAGVRPALPTSALEAMISVTKPGSQWFVTDMVNILHYQLSATGGAIAGSLEAQLYVVPQDTQLGPTKVPQGLKVNGELDLFGFTATLDIDIQKDQGFTIDAAFSKMAISVNNFAVFSFASADGSTGPQLQVNTIAPNIFFKATGSIAVLGVNVDSAVVNFTETGGSFSVSQNAGVAAYSLQGSYSNNLQFSLGGTADIGVNQSIDLGPLGSISVDLTVNFTVSVSVESATSGSGTATGSFSFEGHNFTIASFSLALNTTSLANLATDAAGMVEEALKAFLGDMTQWLNWVKSGVVKFAGDASQVASQVGSALKNVYNQTYDQIATATSTVLNYASTDVASALQGAGATATEAFSVMVNTLKMTEQAAQQAIVSVFTGSAHVDTTIIPHVDTQIPPHGDTSTPHVDTQIPPHGDTSTPHVDTEIPPHGDASGPHVDIHEDFIGSVHVDSSPHIDTPSVHEDVGHVHVDTPAVHEDVGRQHVDTPAVHEDTGLHGDFSV